MSRVQILLLVAGALCFVVGGVWIAGLSGMPPQPGKVWIGWLLIVFFGACEIAGGFRLFNTGEEMQINSRGVYWRQWSETVIPWHAVERIEEQSVNSQRLLSVYLKNPTFYPSTTILGKLAGANRALGFASLALNTMGTDQKFDEMVDAVKGGLARSKKGSAAQP